MKPLLISVVALCVVFSHALPENIEEVKELPQSKQPVLEAEESEPQARKERCTTCSGSIKLNIKSPNEVLAALQALPGAEVHTQQSYESCSSDKGCAGIKVKDGRLVEKFGNVDAFKAAAAADTSNEFQFHAGGALGNVFEGGLNGNAPFWWMNQNSPFKNGGGSFEKFSKSSSSYSTSGNAAANGAPFLGGVSGSVDLSGNPFLNGDFSKISGGFASGAGSESVKPSAFQSSAFESSSFSSSSKDVDLTKNPFLNGGIKFGQAGLAAQTGFGSNSGQFGAGASQVGNQGAFQTGFQSQSQAQGVQGIQGSNGAEFGGQFALNSGASNNRFGAGYTGSSPSPFTASTSGSNVNLIQNSQKASEFDFEQQQQTQQNIDEAFQSTGNVHAHEHSGGELQQTCAGQGYVCVHKAQCNNGVVNTNGAGILQARTQKQYCNTKTEICCRMEISSLSGAGSLQGSLGVGSATFSGSGSQGNGLFVTGQSGQGSFGAGTNGFGQNTNSVSSFGSNTNSASAFGSGQNTNSGSAFGSSQNTNSASAFGSGQNTNSGSAFGSNQNSNSGSSFGSQTGQSSFGSNTFGSSFGSRGTFGQGTQTTQGQGAFGQGQGVQGSGTFESGSGFSATGTFGSSGSSGSANRGVSTTGFESGVNTNKFGSSSSGSSSSFGTGFSSPSPTTNRFNGNNNFNNEVYKSTSQSNFIETDSFSAGSESAGVFRPGASGSGLKPGIPYLPPVDNVNQPSIISSTVVPTTFVTTPRPFTTGRPTTIKPTYLPPVSSTSAPGYLPPEQSDSSNQRETRIPGPNYVEGGILLDQTRQPRPNQPRPTQLPGPNDIPAGCAAALKCTPIEFCTAEGVISNSTVILTRDQESYRVPLTDCKDLESGRIGKCCRDPLYTDPWPTNQLGKWVPGVFGGNDGKYVPDSRGAGNNPRPQVTTLRPPVTGNVLLNNFRSPKPTTTPFGPNQVTPGFPATTASSFAQKGQFEVRGQGQFGQGGQGQFAQGGQGQFGVAGQGTGTQLAQGSQFTTNTQSFSTGQRGQGQFVEQGQGSYSSGGRGQFGVRGQGQLGVQGLGNQGQFTQFSGESQKTFGQGQTVSRGQGQTVSQGQGFGVSLGGGKAVTQGQGFGVSLGGGQAVSQGQGQAVSQGQGFGVSLGGGQAVTQGQGQAVSQGQGFGVSLGGGQTVSQGGIGVIRELGQAGQGFIQNTADQGLGFIQGQIGTQGQGVGVSQGVGFGVGQGFGTGYRQGFGQSVITGQGLVSGQGEGVSQGFGSGIRQGFGQAIVQGEGQASASEEIYRVFLGQYSGSGQCGLLNGQKPYGNRNDLEVDFAEIPWQAMVLLQTNRSLLCGGVITRPDVVITSAACVEGLEAKNVLIKGGEWKLGIDDEPLPFQIVQVKNILRHPFYKSGNLKYDAAILVLTENLRLAKNIYPICLPKASDTLGAFYNGAGECIVTGWGKQVLQAHLAGSIMHSLNVSLINPGECQNKLSSDYPHLLDQYDQESCACGQPLNPVNNICKVDIGSALACTTDNEHYVLRGIYSWDSGCQTGNQLAAFYKFDLEWYEWAIGLIESVRFAKYSIGTKVTQNRYSSQLNSAVKGGQVSRVKGSAQFGVKGSSASGLEVKGIGQDFASQFGVKGTSTGVKGSQEQFGFSQFGSSKFSEGSGSFGTEIKGPISNSFTATYSEKKVFQSEPEIITYTTKPEIVTFTTKPEYFTYTTKPKYVTYTTKPQYVTYTTKPQIIRYETSGSGTNPQYVAPGVTYNPSFSEISGIHKHNAQCKCLEKGKK